MFAISKLNFQDSYTEKIPANRNTSWNEKDLKEITNLQGFK